MSHRFFQATAWLFVFLFPVLLSAQIPSGGMRPGMGNAAQMNIGRFYGKVIDETTGEPLAYASVQLLGMQFDSVARKMQEKIIAGQLTRDNGEFSLENLPVMGEYTLKISYLSYASYEKKISFGLGGGRPGGGRPNGGGGRDMSAMAGAVDKDLGNIRLAASSQLLKEVEVRGDASQVVLAMDKKVYRVDKDNVAAGGTAEDALKNVPSLNVDIDGNLTMRNAAPQIFVDGRPTNLTLDQIPADAIDNVEVITNPSAKYDASGGGAGIVNIVLKKERRIGYNGSLRTGVDMRGRFNFGGDINAREGKVNAFLGVNYNQRRNLSTGATDRFNQPSAFSPSQPYTNVFQTQSPENNGLFAMLRGGVDVFLNNRNTLTISGNYHGGNFKNEDEIHIQTDSLRNPGGYYNTSNAVRYTSSEREFRNFGSQLGFKHLFPKEGKEWTADLNLNGSRSENLGFFRTEYDESSFQSLQRQRGDGGNTFFTAQTDFVNPISKAIKMEIGARIAVRDFYSNNENAVFDSLLNDYRETPTLADNYKFHDVVGAVYGTYSQQFSRWGYQIGLRAESSDYTGTLVDRDTTFGNSYPLSLFPSAFLTYKINEEDNLQLSFTRRINRPSFFQLIPFTDFSDSLILQRGNSNLLPEFAHSVELSYQNVFSKGHNLLVSAYYKQTNNLLTRYAYQEIDPVLNRPVIISTFANTNSSTAYGVEFTLKNTFWKIVELTSNINLYNSILNAENIETDLQNEQFTYFIKENLNLKLPRNFTLQLNGAYQSRTAFDTESSGGGRGGSRGGHSGGGWGGPSSTAQGYTIPVWYVDASVRKDFWNRKASLTLSVQDIFRSRKTGSHTESAGIFVQDTWRRRDPQLARLTFSYRFGKFDVSLFRRKNTRVETEGMDGF
ncbi:MAG: TonB-dependent receptor [Saprospiraceae bacterium]|nr:TonB-dependent receptor [Saprospiraceae bacterium]